MRADDSSGLGCPWRPRGERSGAIRHCLTPRKSHLCLSVFSPIKRMLFAVRGVVMRRESSQRRGNEQSPAFTLRVKETFAPFVISMAKFDDSLDAAFVLSEETSHSCTGLQPVSGSNSLMAVAVSVVVFPKSFWNSTPSWLMMNVITPELPYSAG
jgi:hypothetical protein